MLVLNKYNTKAIKEAVMQEYLMNALINVLYHINLISYINIKCFCLPPCRSS